MLSIDIEAFLIVFDTFSQKVVETWFVCHENWHKTLFGIFYCVEVVRIKNNSHMLEICVFEVSSRVFGTFLQKVLETWFVCNVTWHTILFGYNSTWFFLSVFGSISHKVVQTWFLCHENWHTTLFGIFYYIEMVIIKNNSYMLENTCKIAFLRFF